MTPRDVVHLATTLLLDPDDALFEANPGLIRTLYDPTCGTGGFPVRRHEPRRRLRQPLQGAAGARALRAGTGAGNPRGLPDRHAAAHAGIRSRARSVEEHQATAPCRTTFAGERFHYCLANPPFGKKWEKDQKAVEDEHKEKGYAGRFGPGLPRINDGSMLFCCTWPASWSCPRRAAAARRSCCQARRCSTAAPAQGESEIRRWLLEKDLVEAIIALPTEIFFRTGIGTYLWILSNKKPATAGTGSADQRHHLWTLDQERGQQAAARSATSRCARSPTSTLPSRRAS
jgi:type I restriction enzyme M protein